MTDSDLDKTDLVVDEVYGGSRCGNAADDPLPRLLGVDTERDSDTWDRGLR